MWAALAGSLVFWGLRLTAHAKGLPAQVQTVATDQAMRGDVLRLLGGSTPVGVAAAPVAPPAAARFKLVGAVASTGAGPSWAVLSVDDKPPRAIRVGGVVDGEWVVQGVSSRSVRIGRAGAEPEVTLDLPQLPPAATGVPASLMPAAAPQVNGAAAAAAAAGMRPPVMAGQPQPIQDGVIVQPAIIQPPPPPPPGAEQQAGGDPNAAR